MTLALSEHFFGLNSPVLWGFSQYAITVIQASAFSESIRKHIYSHVEYVLYIMFRSIDSRQCLHKGPHKICSQFFIFAFFFIKHFYYSILFFTLAIFLGPLISSSFFPTTTFPSQNCQSCGMVSFAEATCTPTDVLKKKPWNKWWI